MANTNDIPVNEYASYLERWHAAMVKKYGGGYPDFLPRRAEEGDKRAMRSGLLMNRVEGATRAWKEPGTSNNLTPRAAEKILAKTQVQVVIPIRRGA